MANLYDHLLRWMAVCCVLALGACVPLSKFPLPKNDTVVSDPRLPGIWVTRLDDGDLALNFSNIKDSGNQKLAMVFFRDKGGLVTHTMRIFSIELESKKFLNIEFMPPGTSQNIKNREGEKLKDKNQLEKTLPLHFLASYRLDGQDALHIKLWSLKEIRDGIEQGRFSGTVLEQEDDFLIVEDSHGNSLKFIKTRTENYQGEWLGPFKKIMTPKVGVVD